MKQLMKKIILALLVCAGIAAGDLMLRAAEAAAQAPPPAPSLEQRIASLEAYVNNGDPTAPLKDKDGKIPDGLVTPTSATSGPGHNAWMMTCAALVLFMTLPGLALFYGGLVRRKNVLSVLAQCLGITGLVAILWWLFGYSFVFAGGDGAGAWIGDFKKHALLSGVDSAPNTDYAYWVSHNVFSMYQMMFAIITPALIIGAIAERMKFSAIVLFMALWMAIVYFPLAHWVWGITGAMNGVWNAHGCAHVLRVVSIDPLFDSWKTARLRQGTDAPPQHGSLYGGHGNVVGRMVWF
jgi:Amt family ammonium transporter